MSKDKNKPEPRAGGFSPPAPGLCRDWSGTQVVRTEALVNGRIQTMDAGATVADVVTIRNSRFVTVGGVPQVSELKERKVVPNHRLFSKEPICFVVDAV